MHMAPRVAAWVAWAAWTCKTRSRAQALEAGIVEKSGLRPAFFMARPAGRTHSGVKVLYTAGVDAS
jgi:hypothetical protein